MIVGELSAVDSRILEVLRENGRISNVELARSIGVSEKTVRQRIARLVDHAGLRFHAEIDDTARPTQVLYLINTAPGQRLSVAEQLARLAPIDSVRLTTGSYEMIVEASFDTDTAALEFYVHDIEARAGVERSTSIHVIKSVRPAAPAASARFAEFDAAAARIDSLATLFDLACDVASAELGARRVFAGRVPADGADVPSDPVFSRSSRWRGLSSRYIEAIHHNIWNNTIVPTLASRGQHLFVADAQTDPLFAPIADVVAAEGFHSFLALPIRHEDEQLGSINLYYDTIIHLDAERIAEGQELADAVGKHIARIEPHNYHDVQPRAVVTKAGVND